MKEKDILYLTPVVREDDGCVFYYVRDVAVAMSLPTGTVVDW